MEHVRRDGVTGFGEKTTPVMGFEWWRTARGWKFWRDHTRTKVSLEPVAKRVLESFTEKSVMSLSCPLRVWRR
jgi:hypothetical protein